MRAIKSLKSGKTARQDGIPLEALRADVQTSTDMLHPLLVKIWETEAVPEDWKKGLIVKLPKKGDLSQCNNWRKIVLLSIPGKVLSRIILETRDHPGQDPARRTGSIPSRQILYGPHCHDENHH